MGEGNGGNQRRAGVKPAATKAKAKAEGKGGNQRLAGVKPAATKAKASLERGCGDERWGARRRVNGGSRGGR
jgi:hypothetical protein